MKIKMINNIAAKFCPNTILLNFTAIGVSFTDLEIGLKILSYTVAILYTAIKIAKELREWKKKKKK
tara:strand:- start:386 stop:583 length:198 start_codon:yes stop_codon:yes gene_type:complete